MVDLCMYSSQSTIQGELLIGCLEKDNLKMILMTSHQVMQCPSHAL